MQQGRLKMATQVEGPYYPDGSCAQNLEHYVPHRTSMGTGRSILVICIENAVIIWCFSIKGDQGFVSQSRLMAHNHCDTISRLPRFAFSIAVYLCGRTSPVKGMVNPTADQHTTNKQARPLESLCTYQHVVLVCYLNQIWSKGSRTSPVVT